MFRKSREYAQMRHVSSTVRLSAVGAQPWPAPSRICPNSSACATAQRAIVELLSWLCGLPESQRVWTHPETRPRPPSFQGTRTIVSVKNGLDEDLSLHAVPLG
jgi:hypothetical protein